MRDEKAKQAIENANELLAKHTKSLLTNDANFEVDILIANCALEVLKVYGNVDLRF